MTTSGVIVYSKEVIAVVSQRGPVVRHSADIDAVFLQCECMNAELRAAEWLLP